MKKLILFIGLLLTGCSTTWHVSTTGHDPIYDTVLEVPAGVQIDTLSSSQLRWKLRTDFRFRYDFAQYALSQPRSFDWNNRVLGNRYSFYSPYSFGYNSYWNRDQMWNDWVWGYPFFQSHMWSPFRYDRWGYNHYGWNNYGWNSWGWNGYYGNSWGWRQQMNDYAWHHRNRTNTAYINGRRSSMSQSDRQGIAAMIETSNRNNSRVNVKEEKIDLIVNKIRRKINNNPPRIYNNPNNPNINNNGKPRINNNSKPRIYVRPNNNTNNSRTIINKPSRSNNNTVSRSNIRRKNKYL